MFNFIVLNKIYITPGYETHKKIWRPFVHIYYYIYIIIYIERSLKKYIYYGLYRHELTTG